MGMTRQLSRLATWLGRKPEELEIIRAPRVVVLQFLAIAFAAVGPLYLLYDGYISNRTAWETGQFSVPISDSDWHARIDAVDSPPDPASPALWSGPLTRGSPALGQEFERTGSKALWLGVELGPDRLAELRRARATVLLLGYVSVPPQIWIDGERMPGIDPGSVVPIMFTLREDRFADPTPLRIVIRLATRAGARRPDALYKNAAGFVTKDVAGQVISQVNFEAETRPLILLAVNALLTVIFLVLWISFPRNQEYWYLALFTLLESFTEITLVHTVFLRFSPRTIYSLDLVNEAYQGGFGMLLGLAYARTTLRLMKLIFPFVLLLPLALLPFMEGTADFEYLGRLMGSYVVPIYLSIGAAACLLQALHLHLRRNESAFKALRKRVGRLCAFAAILIAMLLLYLTASNELASAQYVYYQRYAHMGLVLLVGILFILDYRSESLMAERAFVSKWHRQAQTSGGPLPDGVPGLLLKFDMKNSTALSKEFGQYGSLTNQWYHRMTQVLWKHRGEVLFEEGDLIAAFFEGDAAGPAVLEIVDTIRELDQGQRQLRDMLGLKTPITFRASIVAGKLGLVWKQTGPMKKAGYTGDVLVDSTRVLDLEKKIFGKDEVTRVVVEEPIARTILAARPTTEFVLKGQPVGDSDARERAIWAYVVD